MTSAHRVVIAAPSSGSGKTTVAVGLMAALRRRGLRVAPFKIGPDYIDPGYHALAAGAPARNLDPVLVGEQRIAPLFAHGARGADIAVVEGVMGLFDGRTGTATGGLAADMSTVGSTAHVAGLIEAPVVLVVDATGQGRSLAALLHGFRSYDPSVRLAGVILNRVGSQRHEQVLRAACAEVGLPVFGALPRDPELHVPSRHLGLVTAAEHGPAAVRAVEATADVVGAAVDLDALLALAATARPLATRRWEAHAEVGEPAATRPVVAVAGGAAFTFGYAEHVELLRACGAEVVVLDPLRDEGLPAATAGLVLPGGFPEQHTEELSANVALRAAVADAARAGIPVHAECGGLLYLGERLDGHAMCGVLDTRAVMSDRLVLGYRDAVAAVDSPLLRAGERTVGHEFHRTTVEPASGARPAWHWRDGAGRPVTDGFVHGGMHASYLHTHPAGKPGSVARFVAACARWSGAATPGVGVRS